MSERYGDPILAAKLRAQLSLPLVVAPMFLVSGPELVIASSHAGVIGSLPSLNARTTEGFDAWLTQIDAEKRTPYAVNLIVHATNARLEADLDVCVRHRVPIIHAAIGSPKNVIDKVKGYGRARARRHRERAPRATCRSGRESTG